MAEPICVTEVVNITLSETLLSPDEVATTVTVSSSAGVASSSMVTETMKLADSPMPSVRLGSDETVFHPVPNNSTPNVSVVLPVLVRVKV